MKYLICFPISSALVLPSLLGKTNFCVRRTCGQLKQPVYNTADAVMLKQKTCLLAAPLLLYIYTLMEDQSGLIPPVKKGGRKCN